MHTFWGLHNGCCFPSSLLRCSFLFSLSLFPNYFHILSICFNVILLLLPAAFRYIADEMGQKKQQSSFFLPFTLHVAFFIGIEMCLAVACIGWLVVHYGLNVTECFMHRNCIQLLCVWIQEKHVAVCGLSAQAYARPLCARKRPPHGSKRESFEAKRELFTPSTHIHTHGTRRGIYYTAHCIHSFTHSLFIRRTNAMDQREVLHGLYAWQ